MHELDKMTPNERLGAYLSGGDVDRIPIMPFFVSCAGKVAGMTHKQKRSSAENTAGAQIACYEKYGNDGMIIEFGLHGIAHGFDTQFNDPEDAVPAIIKAVMNDLDDLDKLDPKALQNNDWYKMNIEAVKILNKEYGHEVGTNITFPGPMTAAASLLPIEKLLRQFRKRPEQAHELMRFCTDMLLEAADGFMEAGGGIFLCDPIASGSVIDKKTYREFVLPYSQEIANLCHSKGLGMGYHNCGETNAVIEDLLETGCDMISLDTQVNFGHLKEVAGDRVPILSNVDVCQTMLLGTPADVEENVKQNLRDGWDSPKRMILSNSCDIPIASPMENIDAMMAAGRKYGAWPLDPEKFAE